MKSNLRLTLFSVLFMASFLMPSESFAHVEPVTEAPNLEIKYLSPLTNGDTIVFMEKYYKGTRKIVLTPGQIYNTFSNASGESYIQNGISVGTGTKCPSVQGIAVHQWIPIVAEEFEVIEGKESVASIQSSSGSWTFLKVATPNL